MHVGATKWRGFPHGGLERGHVVGRHGTSSTRPAGSRSSSLRRWSRASGRRYSGRSCRSSRACSTSRQVAPPVGDPPWPSVDGWYGVARIADPHASQWRFPPPPPHTHTHTRIHPKDASLSRPPSPHQPIAAALLRKCTPRTLGRARSPSCLPTAARFADVVHCVAWQLPSRPPPSC